MNQAHRGELNLQQALHVQFWWLKANYRVVWDSRSHFPPLLATSLRKTKNLLKTNFRFVCTSVGICLLRAMTLSWWAKNCFKIKHFSLSFCYLHQCELLTPQVHWAQRTHPPDSSFLIQQADNKNTAPLYEARVVPNIAPYAAVGFFVCLFSLETSDGLRARSAAAAAERDVGLRPASAPQPQPSNPRFHPARTLTTLFRHTRIFSQLYVFRLTARFHSRAPSRDASLLQTLQPDARGLYPSAGHPDVPQPPRPALRGGVRREGDAPRGGGTTLEVSICLFLSGNTSCSCLTAVAAALFVAVDYALRLTKTATKTAISSEWRGGGVEGETSSSRQSALQPPPLAALVLRETRRNKFLGILQAFLAPLGWKHSSALQPGFKNAVCQHSWDILSVHPKEAARIPRPWVRWGTLLAGTPLCLQPGSPQRLPRLTGNGPPRLPVHHRPGTAHQGARRWISQSWEGQRLK